MSHLDSFVVVCGHRKSISTRWGVGGTYIVVVLLATRKVLFPWCLLERSLDGVSIKPSRGESNKHTSNGDFNSVIQVNRKEQT
jgi:hypothetical protein